MVHPFVHRPDGKASRDDVRASRSQSSVGFGNCPAASGRLVSADRSAERDGTFEPKTAVNVLPIAHRERPTMSDYRRRLPGFNASGRLRAGQIPIARRSP